MDKLKFLVMAGSSRQGALSRKLATLAAQNLRAAGHQVQELDLRDLQLPVYDGDLEVASGIPQGAQDLQSALLDCDGVLIVTPEYNGFPTPLVINTFDWLSRITAAPPRPAGLAATANKPVALMASSPGPVGGLRSMNFLRQYLQMAFAMLVAPQQFALGRAHEAFDDSGALKDAAANRSVQTVLDALVALAQALQRPVA